MRHRNTDIVLVLHSPSHHTRGTRRPSSPSSSTRRRRRRGSWSNCGGGTANNALMLSVKVCQRHVAKLFLQIGETLVVGISERVGYGVDGFGGVIAGFPVDGAQDAVFGDGLEGFEETEGFEDGAADC